MKTIPLLTFLIVSLSFGSYAQDSLIEDYNKFSVEANVGLNSPNDLFTPGAYTVDPNEYLNFNTIGHFDLGVRYMINTKFGLKLDGAYDIIEPSKNNGSIPFESKQYRLGFQGVMNLGNVLDFRSFSGRLGLLVHAGLQVSRFEPVSRGDVVFDVTVENGGFIFGVTPQFKISNRIVLTTDATFIQNTRRHLTWDGSPVNVSESNLRSSMINFSAGVVVNLGKHDIHADWVDDSPLHILEEKLSKYDNQLDDIESKLLDTDKDGVPDYLDREPNTPNGVSVNTNGEAIDLNNNGIPDELEQTLETKYASKEYKEKTIRTSGLKNVKLDADDDLVNVYFDFDRKTPEPYSIDDISKVVKYLKSYPNSVAILTGLTDEIGGDSDYNNRLSEIRAKKVHDIMVAMGISESRLTYKGGGVDASVDKDSKDARQSARRVSIRIE